MREPDFAKPVDVKAFFVNKLGMCGCSETDAMMDTVRNTLEWIGQGRERANYTTLFDGNTGAFYLIVGMLDSAGLCDHGVSIRYPFLTEKGEKLLTALRVFSGKDLEYLFAEEEAYDGAWYG